jgi:hypothetical protein
MANVGPLLSVVELKVTLLDVTPQVWRRFRVPTAITLGGLHRVIQIVMGWEDAHLHEWTVGGVSYGNPAEEDWGEPLEDETNVSLAEIAASDLAIRYDYDLGNGWEHLVEVVGIEPYLATEPPIVCLDGARACPPEDCGGPHGYEHLIDALANPDDEEHDELTAWVGDAFDPAEFDRSAINRRLEPLWRL